MLAPAEIEMLSIAIAREEAATQEHDYTFGLGLNSGQTAPSLPAPSEREFALLRG